MPRPWPASRPELFTTGLGDGEHGRGDRVPGDLARHGLARQGPKSGNEIGRQRFVTCKQKFPRSAGGLASWGDCSSTRAWPRPCGDNTTPKKLARATDEPSGISFSEMPGFSPDHSTVPERAIGSAMVLHL